jgi:hypothetical protein
MGFFTDIFLRIVNRADFNTKGSNLTNIEVDNNFLAIVDEMAARDVKGQFPNWAAGTYAAGRVVKHNGLLWISTTSTTGEPSVSGDWSRSDMSVAAHERNRDTQLVTSGGVAVTADSLLNESLFEVGAGTNSLKSKNATSANGISSVAIGASAKSNGGESIAIGSSAEATESAIAIGSGAKGSVIDTCNISGALIVRKANGETQHDSSFLQYSTAEVTILSAEIDLTQLDTHDIPVPTNSTFYPNEVGVICHEYDNVSVASFGSFGTLGSNDDLLNASNLNGITAVKDRVRFATLKTDNGVNSLSFEVTTAATADSLLVRVYFKGLLVEDEQ